MKTSRLIIFLIGMFFFTVSCESEYSKTVKSEMASGVLYDDLILGMKLGETRKDFYAVCWKLNAEEKISQGPGNNYARQVFSLNEKDELTKVELLFYGIFGEDDIMRGMDMKLSYLTYAPWNKDLHSNKLVERLKTKYEKDYPGNSFIKIDVDKGYGDAFVKVDGNRQILVYPISQKDVVAKIEDLRFKKSIADEL